MNWKRGIVRIMAMALCLAAGAVAAQGPPRMGPGRHGDGDGLRRMFPAERSEAAPADSADQGGGPGRGGRLSPEERRQLRRDVHQAGRDIYPERMRGMRRSEMRGQ